MRTKYSFAQDNSTFAKLKGKKGRGYSNLDVSIGNTRKCKSNYKALGEKK